MNATRHRPTQLYSSIETRVTAHRAATDWRRRSYSVRNASSVMITMVLDPKILNHPCSASYSTPSQSFSSGTSPRKPTPTQGWSSLAVLGRRTRGSFFLPVNRTVNRLPWAVSATPSALSSAVRGRDHIPSRILSPGGAAVGTGVGTADGSALTISRANCPGSTADAVAGGAVTAGVGMRPTASLLSTLTSIRPPTPGKHPVVVAETTKKTTVAARFMDFFILISFQGGKAQIGRCIPYKYTPAEAALSNKRNNVCK